MISILEWKDYLLCNGEPFVKEVEWLTPNTYSANYSAPISGPGIYFFVVYTSPNDMGNVVYIGSSNNLEKRYRGHEVKTFLYENYWYVKFYFKETDAFKEIEKNLIAKYRPRFNIQHKGSRSLNKISLNPIFNG